jgi:hypothetical protein
MKKHIYILGIILLNLLMAGLIFKMSHWPGAGVLITLSIGLLVIVFFPLAIINSYRKQSRKKHKELYVAAYITILVILTGALFKIMHWPGAGWLLIIGMPLPFVLFFPLYLRFHKKTQKKYDLNFFGVIFFLIFLAVFSALLALQVSRNVMYGFAKLTDNSSTITQNLENRIEDYYKIRLDSLAESTQREQIQAYHKLGNHLDESIEKLKKQLAVNTDKQNMNILHVANFTWLDISGKQSKNANYLFKSDKNSHAATIIKQFRDFSSTTENIMQNSGGKNIILLPVEQTPQRYIQKGNPGNTLIGNIMVLSLWQQQIRYCELETLSKLQP